MQQAVASVIETEGLTRLFGDRHALSDFSIRVPRGGTHAVVGSNGAGKSTLFRLLLGVLTPTSGSARLLGAPSERLPPRIRGRVGYVNEEHTLPGWMTAHQIIDLQRRLYPQWQDDVLRRVLASFDVSPRQRVASLSRGERAGLNLAIALAQAPELLILDEPTLGMDVVAKQAFLESLILTAADTEATVVYCSHQMDEVQRVADSLIVMERGRLRNFSSPDAFCERVGHWIASFPDGFQPNGLSGILSVREIEGLHHIMVADRGEAFRRDLLDHGATLAQPCPVTLETAVNAFLARDHAAFGRPA